MLLVDSKMYYDANRWDYWEDGVITMIATTIYFTLPTSRSPSWRPTSFALAGVFSAAASVMTGSLLIRKLGVDRGLERSPMPRMRGPSGGAGSAIGAGV
jgi:hypothetical protein